MVTEIDSILSGPMTHDPGSPFLGTKQGNIGPCDDALDAAIELIAALVEMSESNPQELRNRVIKDLRRVLLPPHTEAEND